MGLLRDPGCPRCGRIVAACICNRAAGGSKKAESKVIRGQQPRPIRDKRKR